LKITFLGQWIAHLCFWFFIFDLSNPPYPPFKVVNAFDFAFLCALDNASLHALQSEKMEETPAGKRLTFVGHLL